jgi:FO synthase
MKPYGHIQEVIIQNFEPRAIREWPDALSLTRSRSRGLLLSARLILGGAMNIQVPPNLNPLDHELMLRAGINDWGGISRLLRLCEP